MISGIQNTKLNFSGKKQLLNNVEIVVPDLKLSKISLHLRLSSEVVRKSSAIFGTCSNQLRPSLEIFRNLRKPSKIFENSGSVHLTFYCAFFMHFTENKFAGINFHSFSSFSKWTTQIVIKFKLTVATFFASRSLAFCILVCQSPY